MFVMGFNQIASIEGLEYNFSPILSWIDLENNPPLSYVKNIVKNQSNTANQIYLHDCSIPENDKIRKQIKSKLVAGEKMQLTLYKSFGEEDSPDEED